MFNMQLIMVQHQHKDLLDDGLLSHFTLLNAAYQSLTG